MRQIVAAVDFSEVTGAVVQLAAAMANAFSAKLTLLHVAAPDPDFVGYEAGPQTVRDTRADELREEHQELQRAADALQQQGVDADGFLIEGPTIETIVQRANHLQADLIVVGSHGHGALYRTLLGSTSEEVLRRAGRPVLVVPSHRPGS